ncbi:MAG: dihydroorotate dehydrogenase, partial [Melioribacteraceae bacterium]|nr:dihydroorotate dehydrogenase [Melioribacteraceae bacterium]
SGMLNAIGLANVGVEEFIKNKIPFLKDVKSTLICNIAASTIEEYVECTKILDEEDTIKGFEINVSCPNVSDGGLIFGNDVNAVGKITEKVRAVTNKPLIIKLSPNTSSIKEFASIVKKEGADAVSAINTLVGTSFDIYTKKPKIKNITGGLSGPAIKPVALSKVLEISRHVDIPIIGIGGIMNWNDAIEFMICGAAAIQLGTVNFINPNAAIEILEGIEKYCIETSINNISEITASYKI